MSRTKNCDCEDFFNETLEFKKKYNKIYNIHKPQFSSVNSGGIRLSRSACRIPRGSSCAIL